MDLKVLWTISNSMGTVSDLNMLKDVKAFNVDVVTSDITGKDSAGSVIAGKNYILPRGSEPQYIDKVIDVCKKERVTTIIPQYEDELVPLSKNMELFENMGVKVLVTEDTNMLDTAGNKKKLYEFFKNSDFIPDYRWIWDAKMLENTIYELGYPKTPVCIKPVHGEGGKGFRIVTEEKVDIFNEPPGVAKVTLEVLKQQLKQVSHIPELIAMEYLPGMEYSVDCVAKYGKPYICIPRQRIETSMGVAAVSQLEKNDEIIGLSQKIISELNLSYNVNIQFKYSRTGKPKLVEINPRVSGSLVANYGAGVNMLELSLKLAYGMPIDEVSVEWGTKMMRYWDQLFIKA